MNDSIKYFTFFVVALVFAISFVAVPAENPHGKLKIDCNQCHTTATWNVKLNQIPFRHFRTGYLLLGAHRDVQCMSCHQSLIFSHIGTACIDCHVDVHRGQLGVNCADCHSTLNWENRREIFEQHNNSAFPLLGMHAITDCEACHVNQQQNEFANTPTDCEFCHQQELATTTNPNHREEGLTSDCQRCHRPTATTWTQATYRHQSAFIDRGAHANLPCASCHTENFADISADCFACHEKDYNSTTDPNHAVFGILTDCVLCHNDLRWDDAEFDHVQLANFELRGAHSKIKCGECHVNNQVTDLPRDCFGCHESEFNAVVEPPHDENNFDQDCLQCHTEFVWSPSTFDHNNTQFPLLGAHDKVSCVDCHSTGYATTPTDCFSCHQSDFNTVADPSHVDNKFDHDCLVCHNQSKWIPSTFDHNNTQFPLLGAHTTVSCADCHTAGYNNTATDCFSCHKKDFETVADPSHVDNNFDHDCTMCHDQNKWTPAFFDHNNTQFPLLGAHSNVSCGDCHSAGYNNTPNDCFSCHENDFNAVMDPNHIDNNFDHDCSVCHDQNKWTPATFDHNSTQFPLTGAHTNAACTDCHSNGYSNAATDCYSCHKTEFDKTADPNHSAAGFPIECQDCHSTSNWDDTNWDHDNQYFPIYSGSHRGEWNTCVECHTTASDFGTYSCIDCHEHSKSRMDDKHSGEVRNYVYESAACFDCHPRGKADD
ncbi:MAG: hypothetical protein DWQ05_14845 [Calditrichaeota bacterium]|nr:MAG: hypothetical protein DWQ05_14845 [Calditrichota bacterium]